MKQTRDRFDTAIAGWFYGGFLATVSISDKTSYCIISQSIETPRFVFRTVGSPPGIALKFGKRVSSNAADVPVKFQSDTII